jgi:ribosomal-protein-alanine N-acetyltransferase
MKLTTDRLLLRPLEAGDFRAVHAYASDPEVVRFMDWGPNTLDDTTAFLERMITSVNASPRTQYPLAIEPAGEPLAGVVELQIDSAEHRRADIGYVLGRAAWGKGYASEAAAAMLRFGFGELGLHKISATCDPDNLGSARVLEKIGMRREGVLRDHFLIRGQWRDRLLWAALRTDQR